MTNWDERLPFKIKNFMFGNAQQAFDQLYAISREAVEFNQPLRAAKIKDDKPWMTSDIKALIAERQRLFHSGQLS